MFGIYLESSHYDLDIGDDTEAAPLFQFQEPPPRRFIVQGLVPDGETSLIVGDGGVGKTFFAQHLAVCLATGRPFLGRETVRVPVLIVDAEMDLLEHRRRVAQICRGLGIDTDDDALDRHLYYHRLATSLADDAAHKTIKSLIRRHRIGLVVLDSLTIAAGSADVLLAKDVVQLLTGIRRWEVSVVALDHVTKTAGFGHTPASPFGSAFKRNLARCVMMLNRLSDGTLSLTLTKSNFTATGGRIRYAMDFDETGATTFRVVTAEAADEALSSSDATEVAVRRAFERHGRGVTAEEVHAVRCEGPGGGLALGSLRNHLTRLLKAGRIERTSSGYEPLRHGDDVHDHDPLNSSDNE